MGNQQSEPLPAFSHDAYKAGSLNQKQREDSNSRILIQYAGNPKCILTACQEERINQQTMLGQQDIYTKRINLHPCFTSHRKISLKWIKDLNLNGKTVKFLEKKMQGKILITLDVGITSWI